MTIENFKKDLSKALTKESSSQRLEPGSPRRWEPEQGVRKHNERIHRESKIADNKNLPFTFSKPPKPRGSSMLVKCDHCGYITNATSVTVGIICPECNKYSSVTEINNDR